MNLNNDVVYRRLRLAPFQQPDPSPQSPSSVTSLCRVLACKVAAPPFVPRRVIGQKRIDPTLGRARLDAKCGMSEPCQFHRTGTKEVAGRNEQSLRNRHV